MSRFIPKSPTVKVGNLRASIVEKGSAQINKTGSLILSVPALCGNAVKRNRLRRVIKNYLSSRWNGERFLWIRLSASCRLKSKIREEDLKFQLDKILTELRPFSSEPSL